MKEQRRHKVLVSLGTNNKAEVRIPQMLRLMSTWWGELSCTEGLVNPALGMSGSIPDFTNMLVMFHTSMSYEEVVILTKLTERLCGRRSDCIVDIDILEYDDERHHEKDWERPYIKTLMTMPMKLRRFLSIVGIVGMLLLGNSNVATASTCSSWHQPVHAMQVQDTEKDLLTKALEYFSGQKYDEALLTFTKLEKTRKLSLRMLAYKGLCEFRTARYEDAIKTLTPIVSKLEGYSPHERTVYYYALGESHFQLGHYRETIPLMRQALVICNDSDRGEVCYRLGFSSWMYAEYEDAIEYFALAEKWYPKTEMDETMRAHYAQCQRMLKALLVSHGPRRMDVADEEAWKDENQGADNDSTSVDKKP